MPTFTLIDTMIAFLIPLLLVAVFILITAYYRRKQKKVEDNRYPSAKKYSKIVNAKLDQDLTESFYN